MTQIESMSTEEAVQKYIRPFVVQEYLKTNIDKSKFMELERLRQLAGFDSNVSNITSDLRMQQANDVLHNAMEQLKLNIVLKQPPFMHYDDMLTNREENKDMINLYFALEGAYKILRGAYKILRLPDKIFYETKMVSEKVPRTIETTSKNWLGKLSVSTKTIYEKQMVPKQQASSQAQYMVEVSPQNYVGKVPTSVIEATGKAVEAGLRPRVWVAGTELELKDAVRKQVDPIVVGYANIDATHYEPSHCLLIAAWGKDLEVIDSYFAKAE